MSLSMKHMKSSRDALGMTLAELGERTGIDKYTLGRYENGRQSPSIDRAVLVARALGVSLDELVGSGSRGEPAGASGSRGKRTAISFADVPDTHNGGRTAAVVGSATPVHTGE